MKFLFLSLLMALSFSVFAVEIKMAIITSEFDDNYTNFFIDVEKNEIESMRYVTIMPNGGIFEDISATAEQVIKDGAVIVERDGHQVVRLEVENFSVKTGGTVILNFLYNGATRSRSTKKLNLKLIEGKFVLLDGTKKINRLFLVPHYVRLLGVVGVKEIRTSYQE
jgi:hypothetical protein